MKSAALFRKHPEYVQALGDPLSDERVARSLLGILTTVLMKQNPRSNLAQIQEIRRVIETEPPLRAYGKAALRGSLLGALLGASALAFPSLVNLVTGIPSIMEGYKPTLETIAKYVGGGTLAGALSHVIAQKILRSTAGKMEKQYIDAVREGIYKGNFQEMFDRLKRVGAPVEWHLSRVVEDAPTLAAGGFWPLAMLPTILGLRKALRRKLLDASKLPETPIAYEGITHAYQLLPEAVDLYNYLKPQYEYVMGIELPELRVVRDSSEIPEDEKGSNTFYREVTKSEQTA